METESTPTITVQTLINAPTKKVWEFWTEPQHITQWTFASDDWHAPYAENDLRIDGKFKTTMAAKDGSMRFDFEGVYTDVQSYRQIEYVLGDGRRVSISFESEGNVTTVIETFDPESMNSVELQKNGWQSILDNFKKYVESAV